MAKYALEGALRAHGELQIERDQQWADLSLAYLRATAVLSSSSGTSAGCEREERDSKDGTQLELVLRGLRELAEETEGQW